METLTKEPKIKKSTLRILCSAGDRRLVWRKESLAEIKEARRAFNKALSKKGTSAFRVDKKGEKAERITEFDPLAEEIIVMPMITGG
jgi:hypothetical protein